MLKRYLLFLVLSLLVSCSPLSKYVEQQEVTKWEPDIQKFGELDRSTTYPDDAIIFAGSSSIRLWATLAEDMKPFSVIQRGYGGSKLSDFIFYANRIFSPHKCSALVMFIANDINGGTSDKKPEEVRKMFLQLLKIFRSSHPDTPFFWIEITPSSSRWKVWPQIAEANDLIEKECLKRKNTYFIKTRHAFLNERGEPRDELFINDKLHLNSDGYALWKSIIRQELEKVLIK